jgi:short-subunit dehydrogenase
LANVEATVKRRGLTGRTVVVTGAASGIGATTAGSVARAGARVLLADVRPAALERQRDHLLRAGTSVETAVVDVARVDSVRRLAARALETLGHVGAVVNCAGVISPGALEDTTEEDARRQVEVNLLGSVHVARTFLPVFREEGAGHLVLVASLGGIVPMPYGAVYGATKFAVRGLGLALGLELRGTGVAVSVVCPDSVDTAQLRSEAVGEGSPLSFTSAPLRPDAVARAIVTTLRRPRAEVLVPRLRGRVARALGARPALLSFLYPALRWEGERRRLAYLTRMATATGWGPDEVQP